MHLIDRFADFTHGVQQDGRMFNAAARLLGQIVQVLTHRPQFRHQDRQVGIHLRHELLRFSRGFPDLNQQRTRYPTSTANAIATRIAATSTTIGTPFPAYRTSGFLARQFVACS